MLTVWIDKSINRIKLQTDDPSVRYFLESSFWETRYLPRRRKSGRIFVTERIYDEKGAINPDANGFYTFTVGLGWAPYIANVFKPFLSPDDYRTLIEVVVADSYRTVPFEGLRDYQNDDVLHMLHYKIGLFGCYTGYGLCNLLIISKL